jgi:predicted ABC-type ATPase
MPPHAILLAGANGSGKTTFARQLLSLQNPAAQFLNADEIQREAKSFSHPVAAGRELLHRLAALEASRKSFAIETTLASNMYARRIRTWRDHGYVITLHFIELPSADYAVERVRRRVAAGGHAVPEADVRRRFIRGLRLFAAVYRPRVDRWYHWVSDEGGLRLADHGRRQ